LIKTSFLSCKHFSGSSRSWLIGWGKSILKLLAKQMALVNGKLSKDGLFYLHLELNPNLTFKGVVIDFETTSFDPKNGEIICGGFAFKNTAVVIIRTKKLSKEDFYNYLQKLIESLKQHGDFYAYNAPFEKSWLKEHLNLPIEVKEIMKAAKGITYKLRDLKGWHKTPKLRELLHPRFFHYFGFSNWDIDSGEVGKLWKEHLRSGNIEPLNLIAQHNLLDILSELELLTIWNPYMEHFLNNREVVKRFSNLKCDICGEEKPIEELALITYPERKENGGFRFREMRVCKGCLDKFIKTINEKT
jgi:uncharacterized protein YprB with RNaseH-like and TPR domain